ncbi:MAG: hypothetical protein MUF62_04080, partial [Chitinophagaceae bacterium]|nr:hypothetical protein [Chitinophagaceae bacterium]
MALYISGLATMASAQTPLISQKEKALATAPATARFEALYQLLQEHHSMLRDSLDARSLRLYTWSLASTDALTKAKG